MTHEAMQPKAAIAARLRALAARFTMPAGRDEEGRAVPPEPSWLSGQLEALAVEVEAQAEKLRQAPHDISWSAVEDVADALAAKPEEKP